MKRSPAAAFWLSIVPGAGHVYLGQPAKGLGFIVAVASSIFLAAEVAPTFFGPMIGFLWIFNMVDAHRTAIDINHRVDTGQPLPDPNELGFKFGTWWGWALIALGAILTADNFGWLDVDWVLNLWPIGLIAAGVLLLKRPTSPRNEPPIQPSTTSDFIDDDA